MKNCRWLTTLALALLTGLSSAQAASPALFGTFEYRNESLDALPQWQRVLEQVDKERSVYEACANGGGRCANKGLAEWQEMVGGQVGRPRIEQIRAVNGFVNQWTYRSDTQNYGKSDYWATPSEFFKRSGDCEDYAIVKYVSLRQLGFKAEQLRLVVVKDTVRNLAHAVLAVYVDGDVFILDNLSSQVLPQERITTYAPYYSINESARWAHVVPPAPAVVASNPPRTTGSVARLSISTLLSKS